jgi:type I restriction enzyme M protein
MAFKAYVKSAKEFPQHPDSWITDIEDRLDAEFYWKRSGAGRQVDVLRKSVTDLLETVRGQYSAIETGFQSNCAIVDYETVPVGDFVEEVQEKEKLKPDQFYKLIGVRWWGGGAFIREEKLGREIKTKSLNGLSAGWVIYNRLFAFRGSFAILDTEHEGCYASNEFPTFKVKEKVAKDDESRKDIAKYIVHCFNSPQYLQVVDAKSTGSTKTSRNRYYQDLFVKQKIRMPKSLDSLKRIVQLLDTADNFRRNQATLLERVKELRQGMAEFLPLP